MNNKFDNIKEYIHILSSSGMTKLSSSILKYIDYITGKKSKTKDLLAIQSLDSSEMMKQLNSVKDSNINLVCLALRKVSPIIRTNEGRKIRSVLDSILGSIKSEDSDLPEPLQLPNRPIYNVPDGWVDLGLESGNLWANKYLETNDHSDISVHDIEYFAIGEPYSKSLHGLRNHIKRYSPVYFGTRLGHIECKYSYYEDINRMYARNKTVVYNSDNSYVEDATNAQSTTKDIKQPSYDVLKKKAIFIEDEYGNVVVSPIYDAARYNLDENARIPSVGDFNDLGTQCNFVRQDDHWTISSLDGSNYIDLKFSGTISGSKIKWHANDSDELDTEGSVEKPYYASDVCLLVNKLDCKEGKPGEIEITAGSGLSNICRLSTIKQEFISRSSSDGVMTVESNRGTPILPVRYDKCEEVKYFHNKLKAYVKLENTFNNLPEKTSSEYTTAVNAYNELVLSYNEQYE